MSPDWSGVCARLAIDRFDDFVEMLKAFDGVMRSGRVVRIIQAACDCLIEGIDKKRRLSAAGNPGNARQKFRGISDINALEIVPRAPTISAYVLNWVFAAPGSQLQVRLKGICP